MGTIFSSPESDDPNPNTGAATTTTTDTGAATKNTTAATMSQTPSENPTNPDQENTSQPSKTLETLETLNPNEESSKPVQGNENPDQELGEEEEGECPFCAYMKGGECRETFINWENCIEEGEKNGEDIVDKCVEVTSALKKCMEANQDYYAPILQAEKMAEKEAISQLEQEKAKEAENAKGANEASSGEEEKVEKAKQETS